MTSTIDLVVGTNRDGSPFYESILVDVLGENRYRVAASPGLAQGMAAGDEIELAPDEPLGYRILKRGGNISVQFFWHDGDIKQCLREMEPKAEAIGGRIDGETPGLLVFTLPVAADFPAIEEIFKDTKTRYPGSVWMYGNVFDPADGKTPLNWWAKMNYELAQTDTIGFSRVECQFQLHAVEETVSELKFSFSPGFSLGFIRRAHLKTVSTVYQSLRQSAHSEELGKPLKRFRNFKRTLNPRLKPGENEKLSSDTVSEAGGIF